MRNSCLIALAIISVFSGARAKADSRLPANLDLPGYLAAVVTHVYEQSETFRAQCGRLAQARDVRVRAGFDFSMRCSCRAFTVFSRERDVLVAEIHLAPGGMLAELIAHEFEHILEQMEHLDLRTLSHVRGSGVYTVSSGHFETERAQQVGRVVLAEVRHHRVLATLPADQVVLRNTAASSTASP
jgi:hypothetical protein